MNNSYIKSLFYKIGTTLEPKACKIFLIMYGLADNNGKVNTSLADLHKKSNMSISTIRSALKELQKNKILKINHKIGLVTDYTLLLLKNTND